jgi:hypothetical protein
MRRRGLIVLLVTPPLATVDLVVKASVHTEPWNFHQRTGAWVVLSLVLVAAVGGLTALPSRAVALFAGVLNAGGLGNLVSAAQHRLVVPNPFVLGQIAFNLADVFVVVGVLGLVASIGQVAIRHRDYLLPPRRWERAVLRRLGA